MAHFEWSCQVFPESSGRPQRGGVAPLFTVQFVKHHFADQIWVSIIAWAHQNGKYN